MRRPLCVESRAATHAASLALVSVLVVVSACAGDEFQAVPSTGAGGAGGAGAGVAGDGGDGGDGGGGGSSGAAGLAGAAGAGATAGASGSGGAGGAGDAGATSGGAAGASGGAGGASAGVAGASGGEGGVAGASSAGAGGAAGTDAAGASGGAGAPGCPVLFVKSGSLNDNDGCSEATPLPTISAAIARAKEVGSSITEVRVCAGTFSEPAGVVIDTNLRVRGSFGCGEGVVPWTSPPAEADQASTLVEHTSAVGVSIGANVGRAGGLEGFKIRATADGEAGVGAVGIAIAPGASPTVERNWVERVPSVGSGSFVGAMGLLAGTGSGALIRGNILGSRVGRPTATPDGAFAGTVGAMLDRPSEKLVFDANLVAPAAGTTFEKRTRGTVGMLVLLDADGITLRDNEIVPTEGRFEGVNPTDPADTVVLGSGLVVVPASPSVTPGAFVVEGGAIAGPLGIAEATSGAATHGLVRSTFNVGVEVGSQAQARADASFRRVRIFGGDTKCPASAATGSRSPQTFGLSIENADVKLDSCLVYGGGRGGTTPFPRALQLSVGASVTTRYSTLVAGTSGVLSTDGTPQATNQIVIAAYNHSDRVALFDSVLVGTSAKTFGIYANGNACNLTTNATAPGYVVSSTRSVYIRDQTLGVPPQTNFTGGGKNSGGLACPQLGSAVQAASASAGHIVGELVQIVSKENNLATAQPTLPGCQTPESCVEVAFPGAGAVSAASLLEAANATFRPACGDTVPEALSGTGGALPGTLDVGTMLDLLGKSRAVAKKVGPGAFLTCAP